MQESKKVTYNNQKNKLNSPQDILHQISSETDFLKEIEAQERILHSSASHVNESNIQILSINEKTIANKKFSSSDDSFIVEQLKQSLQNSNKDRKQMLKKSKVNQKRKVDKLNTSSINIKTLRLCRLSTNNRYIKRRCKSLINIHPVQETIKIGNFNLKDFNELTKELTYLNKTKYNGIDNIELMSFANKNINDKKFHSVFNNKTIENKMSEKIINNDLSKFSSNGANSKLFSNLSKNNSQKIDSKFTNIDFNYGSNMHPIKSQQPHQQISTNNISTVHTSSLNNTIYPGVLNRHSTPQVNLMIQKFVKDNNVSEEYVKYIISSDSINSKNYFNQNPQYYQQNSTDMNNPYNYNNAFLQQQYYNQQCYPQYNNQNFYGGVNPQTNSFGMMNQAQAYAPNCYNLNTNGFYGFNNFNPHQQNPTYMQNQIMGGGFNNPQNGMMNQIYTQNFNNIYNSQQIQQVNIPVNYFPNHYYPIKEHEGNVNEKLNLDYQTKIGKNQLKVGKKVEEDSDNSFFRNLDSLSDEEDSSRRQNCLSKNKIFNKNFISNKSINTKDKTGTITAFSQKVNSNLHCSNSNEYLIILNNLLADKDKEGIMDILLSPESHSYYKTKFPLTQSKVYSQTTNKIQKNKKNLYEANIIAIHKDNNGNFSFFLKNLSKEKYLAFFKLIAPNFLELSLTKASLQVIKVVVELASPEIIYTIYKIYRSKLTSIINDQFGNIISQIFIAKVFEYDDSSSNKIKKEIWNKVKSNFVLFSNNQFGIHFMKTFFSLCIKEQEIEYFIPIQDNLIDLITNCYGITLVKILILLTSLAKKDDNDYIYLSNHEEEDKNNEDSDEKLENDNENLSFFETAILDILKVENMNDDRKSFIDNLIVIKEKVFQKVFQNFTTLLLNKYGHYGLIFLIKKWGSSVCYSFLEGILDKIDNFLVYSYPLKFIKRVLISSNIVS